MEEIYKRVIARTFKSEVPLGKEMFAKNLANEFIQWLRNDCDVVLRKEPSIMHDEEEGSFFLIFRVGLMEKFDKSNLGQVYSSDKAYEEFVKVTGTYLKKVEE